MTFDSSDSIWFEQRLKFSDNPVFSITQDNEGFMWFGTTKGLYLYNGIDLNFYPIKATESQSHTSNWIWTVHISKTGNLWVGTSNGLLRRNKNCNCFEQLNLLDYQTDSNSSIWVRKIFEDSLGNLWFGTNYGVFVYDNKKSSIIKYPLKYELDQNVEYKIFEISEIASGRILFALSDGIKTVANVIDINNRSIVKQLPKIQQVEGVKSMLYIAQHQKLWIGSQSDQIGLLEFDFVKDEMKEHHLVGSSETNSIRVIKDFQDSTVWIGTMDGIVRYHPEKNKMRKYLEHVSVRDIYKDKIGGIWVATYNDGVYYYHPQSNRFQHIYESALFSLQGTDQVKRRKEFITSFAQVDSKSIWIGSEYGLKRYNPKSSSFETNGFDFTNNSLVNNRIKCLRAYDDKLYIGTFNGLSILDQTTNKTQNLKLTKDPENQFWNEILAIEINEEKVWIGSNGGGLFLYENGELNQYSDHFNNSANQINVLSIDRDKLWVGSNGGLSSIDISGKTFRRFLNGENYLFPDFNVVSIARDNLGNFWLGTEHSGLIYLDPKTEKYFIINSVNGLLNPNIKSIIVDQNNQLWASSDAVLYQIILNSDSNEAPFTINDFSINTEFGNPTFSISSALKTTNGDILFGTRHGFIKFNPNEIKAIQKYPEVVIYDIEINQESFINSSSLLNQHGIFNEMDMMKLAHDQSVLSFKYSSLDYNQKDGFYYSYLLKGVDKEWNTIGKKNQINFNYLPPGEYTLQLKASNSFNKWGENYSTFKFRILPPFYKSPIAFCCYALLILLLLYLFYYQSSKWHKMKTALSLEEMNKNKEFEVHQMKSEFFLNISHELKTPLALIIAPLKDLLNQKIENVSMRNRLVTIKRNADRIENLVNQIVEVKKLESSIGNLSVWELDINQFIKQIGRDFNELSRLKNINFEIKTNSDLPKIWLDPQKMEIVLNNLLFNSFKYTGENGRIKIGTTEKIIDHKLFIELFVEDSGAGIAKEDIPYLFDRFQKISRKNRGMSLGDGIGLDLAQKIINLHHSMIEVVSIPQSSDSTGLTRFSIDLHVENLFEPDQVNEGDYNGSNSFPISTSNEQYNLVKAEQHHELVNNTILIADPNRSARAELGMAFFDFTQIYEASDGMEAWRLMLDISPSIIICNRELPTIDGNELCRRIKEDDRTCHIPVVMLSNDLKEDNSADETYCRPLDLSHIRKRVDYLIEQRERIRHQIEKQTILRPQELSSYDEMMLDKVVSFIEENLADPTLSVAKISHEVGLSRTHFYRKIKALMNMSPNSFIRTYRIRKAGQLLRQNKQNISDVRIKVGFNDADYFRTCFKKEFGETPSDYVNSGNMRS